MLAVKNRESYSLDYWYDEKKILIGNRAVG